MKIGILTFHRSINNGAVMQCYSLSKRLSKEFPDVKVEVIDYHMPKIEQLYLGNIFSYIKSDSLLTSLKKLVLSTQKLMYFKRQKKMRKVFENAMAELPLSDRYIFDNNTNSLFQYINDNYDILIIGSDAVWNYTSRGFPNAYFPNELVKPVKLSYAASCYGMDFLKCENNRKAIGESLSTFDFLGVRDEATENFVRWSGCETKPFHTCDPTAFLDVNDLPINHDEFVKKMKARGFDFDRPTIGVMGDARMLKMVRGFYGNDYQLVALYNYLPGADVQLYDISPFEWAYIFRYFQITFTIFFHGTMLSLRNGVPVICISRETEFEKNHVPKTLDVLKRIGVSDWYFHTDYNGENYDIIRKKADELLKDQPREFIISQMEKEAASFDNFKNSLENIYKLRKEGRKYD